MSSVKVGLNSGAFFAPVCPGKVRHRPDGKWSLSQFKHLAQIGSGHSSIVYLVWDTVSNVSLALKCYRGAAVDPSTYKQVVHEIEIHARLDHPNILPLYGAFIENEDILLIMPYASQGTVFRLLRQNNGPYAEEFAVSSIILPFLRGLAHLHSLGIMHRDIKTENVVVDENCRLMIADFGLAVQSQSGFSSQRVGTPLYMAPEVFNISSTSKSPRAVASRRTTTSPNSCDPSSAPTHLSHADIAVGSSNSPKPLGYTNKADCWSAAVFIYEVLTGSTPFGHIHNRKALERAVLFKPISIPPTVSQHARDFLTAALDRMPLSRMSVHDMLKHTWIRTCIGAEVCPVVSPAPSAVDVRHASAPNAILCVPARSRSSKRTSETSKGSPGRRVVGFAPPSDCDCDSHSGAPSSSTSRHVSPVRSGFAARGFGPPHPYIPYTAHLSRGISRPVSPEESPHMSPRTSPHAHRACHHACSSVQSTLRGTSTSAQVTPRVSSLTQALLAADASPTGGGPRSSLSRSLELYPSPPGVGGLSCVLPSASSRPSPAHSGANAAPHPGIRRVPSFPEPIVTIVYGCESLSPPREEAPLPRISEAPVELELGDRGRSTEGSHDSGQRSAANAAVPDGQGSGGENTGRGSREECTVADSESCGGVEAEGEAGSEVCDLVVPSGASNLTAENIQWVSERENQRALLEAFGSDDGDERYFEVRGSWGGSIDSTAGALAQLAKRLGTGCDPVDGWEFDSSSSSVSVPVAEVGADGKNGGHTAAIDAAGLYQVGGGETAAVAGEMEKEQWERLVSERECASEAAVGGGERMVRGQLSALLQDCSLRTTHQLAAAVSPSGGSQTTTSATISQQKVLLGSFDTSYTEGYCTAVGSDVATADLRSCESERPKEGCVPQRNGSCSDTSSEQGGHRSAMFQNWDMQALGRGVNHAVWPGRAAGSTESLHALAGALSPSVKGSSVLQEGPARSGSGHT